MFAWLQWFRSLVTRHEYHVENFLGMVRLGCMKIMLRC
jgi:transposase